MANADKLIDLTGDFIKYWGFKSVHGKVWAYIYISKQPRSTQEIIDKFGLSKAAISLAIKTLMEYGLIERIEKIEYGIFVYQPSLKIKEAIKQVLANRENLKLKEIIKVCESALNEESEEYSLPQIKKVLKMTQQAQVFLEKFVYKAIERIKS